MRPAHDNTNEIDDDTIDDYTPPAWLQDAVHIYRETTEESPAFMKRYREAGEKGYALAVLKSEQNRVGFVALPFEEYVLGLAKIAKMASESLSPVLEWFGIGDLQPRSANSASLARLGQAIGLNLPEMLALVRMSVAQRQGYPPMSLMLARRQPGRRAPSALSECSRALDQLEAEYNAQVRAELHEIEESIHSIFTHKTPDV